MTLQETEAYFQSKGTLLTGKIKDMTIGPYGFLYRTFSSENKLITYQVRISFFKTTNLSRLILVWTLTSCNVEFLKGRLVGHTIYLDIEEAREMWREFSSDGFEAS
jgi:hypothetical protein